MCKVMVSVLIPVYNRIDLVDISINSVLKQTYKNFEIIIVDNCSTDGTFEHLCRKYSGNNKIRLHQNKENVGPTANWEICLEKANGKYVKFLWSDDMINQRFLEKTVKILEENVNVGMVWSNARWLYLNSIEKETGIRLKIKKIINKILKTKIIKCTTYYIGKSGIYDKKVFLDASYGHKIKRVPVSATCMLARRKDMVIVKEIDNDFGVSLSKTGAGSDVLMYLNILSKYNKFYYINEQLVTLVAHKDSFSSQYKLDIEYSIARKYWLDNNLLSEDKYYQLCACAFIEGNGWEMGTRFMGERRMPSKMIYYLWLIKSIWCSYIRNIASYWKMDDLIR